MKKTTALIVAALGVTAMITPAGAQTTGATTGANNTAQSATTGANNTAQSATTSANNTTQSATSAGSNTGNTTSTTIGAQTSVNSNGNSTTASRTATISTSTTTNASSTSHNVLTNLLVVPFNGFPGTNFLNRVGADSQLKIQIGQIAQTNSTNADIQAFGQLLVTNNTAILQQAQQLGTNIGINLRDLNAQEQRVVERFQSVTGDQFDRLFQTFLIPFDEQEIDRFEAAAIRASNPDVRSFARTNLPTLSDEFLTLLEIRETFLTSTG